MAYQSVFKRYELKYLITSEQAERLVSFIQPYTVPDRYGKTTVRNLYFDTDDYRLIRRSVEKPIYKEKLRLRCYSQATDGSDVFVELKKKYNGIVYKRRLSMSEKGASAWTERRSPPPNDGQISREIEYFMRFYGRLSKKAFISYEREAYLEKNGGDLRITIDRNVLCRQSELSLRLPVYGESVLEPERAVLEIKCSGGIPLWLTGFLSRERIYKTAFSKYGTAYERLILPRLCLPKPTYFKPTYLKEEFING